MRFIHLSDLHIGKRVNDFSMIEDQRYILRQIADIIKEEKPDAVLIAGDVYDKPAPSAEAVQLFEQVDKRPIRLIGAGIYNLSTEYEKQLSFDDYLRDPSLTRQAELKEQFTRMRRRYGLDFEGHLEQIYRWDTLHRTAEYMRKHS